VCVISWAGRSLSGPDGKPEHILLAGADVTALRHGEAQICNRLAELADLHRIHVVEGLGSVIAHDLNQPLASVLLLAESALRQVRSSGCASAELIKDLETIVTQVHRAGAMTKGLRRFLAGANESNAPIDMERTIRGTCELLAPEARAHGIELVLHIAPALPEVRGDASRLEHVLVILIRNGIEAICASGKTQRRIEISALPRDDMVQRRSRGLGYEARVRVEMEWVVAVVIPLLGGKEITKVFYCNSFRLYYFILNGLPGAIFINDRKPRPAKCFTLNGI